MKTTTYTSASPTRAIIRGNWDILKGKLKEKYGRLTDNDLTYVEGQEDELIGRIEKVTGQEAREIERFIKNCNC